MDKLQTFYKSREWEGFVKALRLERTNADGLLICEHCGQPILKPYDCIAHHKTELSVSNVDDVTVSLNSDNIALVHFRCHNEIHKRFGFGNVGRIVKKVYIVYGSPRSGKTTWTHSVAEKQDIILDVDRLWQAVKCDKCEEFERPSELTENVLALREYMIDMIRVRRGGWHNAYIIGGFPLRGERERIADLVGADRVIFIDTPKDVCLERAKLKSEKWVGFVERWFSLYS